MPITNLEILDQWFDKATADHERQNWRHLIVLDPETRKIDVLTLFGNGLPEDIYHDRRLILGSIPDGQHGGCIKDLFEETLLPDVKKLCCMHVVTWNGNNHIGGFTNKKEAEQMLEDISDAINDAAAHNEKGRSWPDSYLVDTSLDEVRKEFGPVNTDDEIDATAQAIVDAAESDNVYLHHGDTAKWIRYQLEGEHNEQ